MLVVEFVRPVGVHADVHVMPQLRSEVRGDGGAEGPVAGLYVEPHSPAGVIVGRAAGVITVLVLGPVAVRRRVRRRAALLPAFLVFFGRPLLALIAPLHGDAAALGPGDPASECKTQEDDENKQGDSP